MMIADARAWQPAGTATASPVDAGIPLNQGNAGRCDIAKQAKSRGRYTLCPDRHQYEVEMLPLRYGWLFVGHCLEVLGEEISPCLSFVTEHSYH
jgi:hypothetical protein